MVVRLWDMQVRRTSIPRRVRHTVRSPFLGQAVCYDPSQYQWRNRELSGVRVEVAAPYQGRVSGPTWRTVRGEMVSIDSLCLMFVMCEVKGSSSIFNPRQR
jgi:hypothetical protein